MHGIPAPYFIHSTVLERIQQLLPVRVPDRRPDGGPTDCVTLELPSLKCNCEAAATGGRGGSIAGRAVTCDWFQILARVGVA